MQKKQETRVEILEHQDHTPQATKQQPTTTTADAMMTTIIARILQGGVIVSSIVIFIGLLLLLAKPGELTTDTLQTFPHTIAQVWVGLQALQPQAVITLGLLLLISTPVIRVAVSILAFALEHDWLYVVITLLVLVILIASFLLGKGGA